VCVCFDMRAVFRFLLPCAMVHRGGLTKGSVNMPLPVYERHRAPPGRARQLSYAVVAVEVR
jgi:hypothetical protein